MNAIFCVSPSVFGCFRFLVFRLDHIVALLLLFLGLYRALWPSYIYEFTIIRYILFIVIITYCSLLRLLRASERERKMTAGGREMCGERRQVAMQVVVFFCFSCCCFDKQAQFRNLLQMSYGHEFIFHLQCALCTVYVCMCVLQSQSLCLKHIFLYNKTSNGQKWNRNNDNATIMPAQKTAATKTSNRTEWNVFAVKMANKQMEMKSRERPKQH